MVEAWGLMMGPRIRAVLLVGMILAAGCGKEEAAPGGAERVTLTFWHIMNYEGPREVLREAVARFEAAHPGVEVKVQTFQNDPYKTKLSIEMASGTPPDVFFTWGGGALASFVKAGKVADLTEALSRGGWRERILPQPLGLCTVEGRAYAVPLDLSCVPVWYNAEMFSRYQLTPPKTFDDLLAVCGALRAQGVTPMALGNRDKWPGAFYFIYLAARTGGARLFLDAAARKPGRRFDDAAFVKAGEHLRMLVRSGVFSEGFNSLGASDARSDFMNGRAAMCVTGTWLVARAQKDKPDFLPRLKCFAFPAVHGGKGDPATMVGGVNCGFAVSSACGHREQAIELVRFLTANEVAEAWCRIGRIPALRVSEKALAQLPAPTRAALDLLKEAKTLQPYYDQYLAPRLAKEHKETTHGLFAGTVTPAEAAGRMEKRAREGK